MSDPTSVFDVNDSSIGVIVAGKPGSGKTFALEGCGKSYISRNRDPNYRILAIAPKGEGYESLLGKKQKPTTSFKDMTKSFQNNTVTIYYPSMDTLDTDIDDAVNFVFDAQEQNPNTRTVIIIDDAQVIISPRSEASPALKRLTLTGRSKSIRGVFVSHSPVFNKALDGQIDTLWIFGETSPSYDRQFMERYNYDAPAYRDLLMERRYSSVYYDVRKSPVLLSPLGE